MKTLVTIFIVALLSTSARAQLISRFSWESNPITAAAYGPNAISASSYATVSSGGSHESKGLNPGGQYDINLVLDGSNFNLPAIDISIDFRREESVASLFYRGSNFNFGMNNGNLSVNFSLLNGQVVNLINAANIYTVPDDHHFHNYHFTYDNNTGIAKVMVDAAIVYSYTGIAGLPLYWTGAGNVIIGKDMDGTGRNLAILDNLIIQEYASALLPVRLLSFTAAAKNKFALIEFTTTQELNVSSFFIEKSANGTSFSTVSAVAVSNGYSNVNHYQFIDSLPSSAIVYYRLKMLNADGSFSYSTVQTVNYNTANKSAIAVYPNPATDYVVIKMANAVTGRYNYTVSSIAGLVAVNAAVELTGNQSVRIDLTKTNLSGIVVITLRNIQTGTAETFSIFRK